MADPASISAQQIAETVKASVQKALQSHSASLPKDYSIGVVSKPPHWIGIIFDDPKSAISHQEAQKLAADLAGAPGFEGHEPAVFFGRDHVTIGFRLPDAPRDEQGHLGPLAELGHLGH